MKPVAPPPSLLLAMAKIFRIRDKDSEDVSRPNNEKKQLRDEDILTVYPSTAIGAKEPRQPCQIHIKHMDRIGAGSFGIVWKIEVLKIKRPFALKFCEVVS